MKLSDDVIAHIARLLQMAILTGTDVVDHLRMVRLETTEDNRSLSCLAPLPIKIIGRSYLSIKERSKFLYETFSGGINFCISS